MKVKLCDYGCGKEAKYPFKNGKWCCEDHCNKCLKMKKESSELHKEQIPWNKGIPCTEITKNKISKKIKGNNHPMYNQPRSEETKRKISKARKHTIEQIQELYPTFAKEEEMRYNPEEKEIQVHCKYSECENSKENGGWFTPTYNQFYCRIYSLEKENGNDGAYLYCSEECKQECCLYYFKSDPNSLTKRKKYNIKIWKITNKSYKKYYQQIKNSEYRGIEHGYALDHKFSIYDGFINNVDPKIIGHYKNLECIPESKNLKKNKNSSITLEELKNQMKEI